jgi:polyhydroxyalkanoate synthase subunit PhaC
MTKQPHDFEKSKSTERTFTISEKWQDNWKKLQAENKKLLAKYMKDSSIATLPLLDVDLFDRENVEKIFQQTMQNLTALAQNKETSSDSSIIDVQSFLHSTLKKVENKTSHTGSGPKKALLKRGEGDENPFFYLLHQSHILNERFLKDTVNQIEKVDPQMSRKLITYTRHLTDGLSLTTHNLSNTDDLQGAIVSMMASPKGNAPLTMKNKILTQHELKGFQLGVNLGTTPGKVVFQNDLFQLIQFEPLAKHVAKQPLLIIPPWNNKYYIFDLTSQNSFVRWALKSGLTVFVLSWVNPDERHQNETLSNYVINGLKCALDQVCRIATVKKVNMLGYCLGGTLIACLLGFLQAHRNTRVASATFLATPFDFGKSDEMGIYRHESQLNHMGQSPYENGSLEDQYLVQVNNLLRANDLIWSSEINHYLLGQEPFPFETLHWVCDALRLPTTMHTAYLRDILLGNQLICSDGLSIDNSLINLKKIKIPIFVMAAEEDHIAPWRSVFALIQVTKSIAPKFVLSASGHIKGVFNHPDAEKYHFRTADEVPKDADEWLRKSKKHKGSWWNEWRKWLKAYEGGRVAAHSIPKDSIIEKAPGSYALTNNK